jgi:SAM-dependent methyltransferase
MNKDLNKLEKHRNIWYKKKILRIVYTEWYNQILKDITQGNGTTIELGAGSGNFKEFKSNIISSDIDFCNWLDMCFDAHNLPFKKNSIRNIIMIDVLHHLSNPIKFLKEASNILEKEGKLIILEPYPSLVSSIVYRLFHPEPFSMNIDYFNKSEQEDKDPWDGNQAIAYILFFKYKEKLLDILKDFKIIKIEKISCILYPLSGGFEHKAMIPDFFILFFKFLEDIVYSLRWLMAFRCYIVIEKI